MALKFLNKKGWHTGSLRNIENVWKAEQKHDAEQKKLDELRKQIQEERERSEFRLLQEQAGLVPRQERLDFLYESGLAVGKGSSDGFKALEVPSMAPAAAPAAVESSSAKATVPGALFEDKPQSANDTWRKLHSDPLLLIRQREQEALSRIKNNPIQMAMIRKTVETEKMQKKDKKEKREKKLKRKHHHNKLKNEKQSDSENTSESEEDRRKRARPTSEQEERSKAKYSKHSSKDTSEDKEERRTTDHLTSERQKHTRSKHEKHSSKVRSDSKYNGESEEERKRKSQHSHSKHEKHSSKLRENEERRMRDPSTYERHRPSSEHGLENKHRETQTENQQQGYGYHRRRGGVPKMTEEERAARLREMQLNAELHEEQRGKRVKKASEADAQEAIRASSSGGKNFLDDAQKSIYGTEKGGSSTIEESVRRRAYYSQGGTAAHESNAFRR